MCVCERERECVRACVYMCVREREGERERGPLTHIWSSQDRARVAESRVKNLLWQSKVCRRLDTNSKGRKRRLQF